MENKMSNTDNSSFSAYYVRPRESGGVSPFSIVMAGDEQCSPLYHIHRSSGEVSVLLYVVSGEGYVDRNGTVLPVMPGDVIILPQGEEHDYGVKRSNPWRIQWFNMIGEVFPYLLKKYGLSGVQVYSGACLAAFFEGCMKLCQSRGDEEEIQDRLCADVYRILLGLWRREAGDKPETTAGRLKSFIDSMIDTDPGQPFSVQEAAEDQSVSVRQLERVFRREYGMTPYQYYQSQKLMLARQYLANTALTIREISTKLGFCDPYYFSNCFKAQEGVSPKRYRMD